jgi:two-component system OmpR family sensor kinase
MIFKSIKWRLQIWYGLILVFVLAGFGFTAYQLEWGRQMRRIDGELQRRVGVLADALHPPPRGPEPGHPPFDRPPSRRDSGFETRPEPFIPGQNSPGAPAEFHLPPYATGLFDTNDPNNFYFVIQTHAGKEIARSANVSNRTFIVENHFLNLVNAPPQLHKPPDPTTGRYFWENFRETFQVLPGEHITVGCSIAPELKEIRRTALNLTAMGGLILLVGLAGGWWLVGRAIRPIEDISATAVKISAGDLSQRIDIAETESELGQLASVLNSTFARLEAAFAQQQQFTSDAAHELRTPVSVMLTQTQTALNRERSGAEYRETLEACQRASQRMRKLIESLLELARLDAGQEILKRLRFDLSPMANDCVELVRPLANELGVKILSELASLEITGDAGRLAQVVTNLLTNAIQYNRPGGAVRVKLELQGSLAVLTVSDTGPGILIEDLPHVFERFYRGDKSRTVANGNAGLGLAISKAIVEAHGGTIGVSSQPDVGTTFTIRLPT